MPRIPIAQGLRLGGFSVVSILALMLSACGRDKQWEFTDAAARGNLGEVKRLYAEGAKLDAYPQEEGTEGGAPALLEAVAGGHDEVVRFFIKHGANLEIGFSDIKCPLSIAVGRGDYAIAKLLLEHGASANHAVGQVLNENNWIKPLGQDMVELLKKHGAITKTTFKRVPPSPFLCTGKVISESGIPAFLDQRIPELYAALESVGAKRSGLLHVNYTGRNLRHPGPFYIEIAVPFDQDKHSVPSSFYFRTASEFKCFAGETSGSWKNIRCGASIIESRLWSEGKAYPTFDMREVYQIWKSADSAENVVEIQFGIHRPARDVHGNRYQEADHFEYETGE